MQQIPATPQRRCVDIETAMLIASTSALEVAPASSRSIVAPSSSLPIGTSPSLDGSR
jgi:hypothetical protein